MDNAEQKEWTIQLVDIPNPCEVPWDSMCGNDQVRFCDQCAKNVYDISSLTQAEATKLLVDHEGRICISMLKRADGTIVTDECPPILKPLRNGYRKVLAAATAVFALIVTAIPGRAGEECKVKTDGTKDTKGVGTPPAPARLGGEMVAPEVRMGGAPIAPWNLPTAKPVQKPDGASQALPLKPYLHGMRPPEKPPLDSKSLGQKPFPKPAPTQKASADQPKQQKK